MQSWSTPPYTGLGERGTELPPESERGVPNVFTCMSEFLFSVNQEIVPQVSENLTDDEGESEFSFVSLLRSAMPTVHNSFFVVRSCCSLSNYIDYLTDPDGRFKLHCFGWRSFWSPKPKDVKVAIGRGIVVKKAGINFGEFAWSVYNGLPDTKPVWDYLRNIDPHAFLYPGITVVGLGIAYLAWRWCYDNRVSFSERGQSFTGTQTRPVCVHCNTDLSQVCTIRQTHNVYKKFYIPKNCKRCALIPCIYGSIPAMIGMSRPQSQCMTTYSDLNRAHIESKGKGRDIDSSWINIQDSSTNYGAHEAFLTAHLQELNNKEMRCNLFLGIPIYDPWTRSYMQATPWLEIDRTISFHELVDSTWPNTKPSPNGKRLLRLTWDSFVNNLPSWPENQGNSGDGNDFDPWDYLGGMANDTTPLGTGVDPDAPDDEGAADQLAIPQNRFGLIHNMRSVWNWIGDHNGLLPQLAIIQGNMSRVRELIRVPEAHERSWFNRTKHYNVLVNEAAPLEPAVIETVVYGPADQMTWFTTNFKGFKLGPVFGLFAVWDTKLTPNLLSILQGRSLPKQIYNKNSHMAGKIARCYSRLRIDGLTRVRVLRSLNEVLDECDHDLVNLLKGKFTEQQINDAIALMEITSVKHIPKRKLNGKDEIMIALEKFTRGVVDNQLFFLAINILSSKVLAHCLFHKPDDRLKMETNLSRHDQIDRPSFGSTAEGKVGSKEGGVFSRMCIKGQDRSKMLDQIISECSQPPLSKHGRPIEDPLAIGEVDQTAMELHQRCDHDGNGTMGHFLGLLHHVNMIILPKLQAKLTFLKDAKLWADVHSGMILKLRIEGTTLTARFKDLYLDSGWINTGDMNFTNETIVSHCAHLDNPEHLFAPNKQTGRLRIEEGSHDFIFNSIPLRQFDEDGVEKTVVTFQTEETASGPKFDRVEVPAPKRSVAVFFRAWIEGDDGIFRLSRIFIDPTSTAKDGRKTNAMVEAEYNDAGFQVKLKYIIDGRGEFVGAHVLVKGGLTDPSLPWVPAVGRYLLKIGLNVTSNPSAANNAARAASLAMMFGGRLQVFATMFFNLLKSIREEIKGSLSEVIIDVQPYSVESRVLSEGKHTLQAIIDTAALAVERPYPGIVKECQMIENSFELRPGSFSTLDMVKLMSLAEVIHQNMEDETAFGYLPAVLRGDV